MPSHKRSAPAAHRGASAELVDRAGRHTDDTSVQPHDPGSTTIADVVEAVETAPIEDLAAVLAGWHPVFGLNCEPRFACTRCGAPDGFVVGPGRWRCSRCRFTGTVMGLRRLVIEDADACDRLLRLLATPVGYLPDPGPADPFDTPGDTT